MISVTRLKHDLPLLSLPMYPFMAGVIPILLYYNTQAVMEVPVDALIVPCAAVVGITLVLYLVPSFLITLIAKRRSWSEPTRRSLVQILALWTALGWTIFFSLSFCIELNGLFSAFHWRSGVLSVAAGILPYLFLLALLIAVIPAIKRSCLSPATAFLNQSFSMLLIMQLCVAAYYFAGSELITKPAVEAIQQSEILNRAFDQSIPSDEPCNKKPSSSGPDHCHVPAALASSTSSCRSLKRCPAEMAPAKPDIYYIVLDEMASSSVLGRFENYDDSWFGNALEERGFFVAHNSLSNYPLTRLSISSSLNMIYLDKFAPIASGDRSNLTPTAVLMRNGAVGKVLRKHGYKYIHIDSSVPPTNNSDIADRVIHCGLIDQFSDKLVRSTLAALSPQAMAWLRQHERETILNQFVAPAQVAAETPHDESVFVFSHILCPHEPFLFDADGKPVLNEGARCGSHWSEDTVAAYTAQAKFAQKKVLATVDSILASSRKSGRMPVIILQGDHGTHCSDYVSSANPSAELLQERYGILNAYLVPSQIRAQLNDQTEPVNTFRIVLRTLFDLNLPNLEERQIYATYEDVFKFKDVTAAVRHPMAAAP